MRPAKALEKRFFRRSSFLTLTVCLGALVPAAWAQRQGAPARAGQIGAVRAPAPARAHVGVAVAPPHQSLPGRAGVAARPGHAATIHAAPAQPAPAVRARENDIVIPLEISTPPRSAPRPVSPVPANGGSIVIAWPAPAGPANRSTRPSPPAPRTGIVGASGTPLLRPAALPRRGVRTSASALVSSSGIVFATGLGAGPVFFGSPFFCDRFDFASFGFSPFFFPGGFCPSCSSPSLGLPLLSVNTFGFGPPFFLPFNRRFFFGRRFFRPRFFGPEFFSGFFPVFGIGEELVASNPAPVEEEEDLAIIPAAVTGGAPSDAERMAAAPSHQRPRTTLLFLRDGSVYTVLDYWLGRDWRVHYVTTYGGRNAVPLDRVDVFKSVQVNLERGGDFILDSGPHAGTR